MTYLDSNGYLRPEYGMEEVEEDSEIRKHKKLLAACLQRAILDFLGRGGMGDKVLTRLTKKKATQWFLSRKKKEFSFVWICEELGFNPDEIRKTIIKFENSPNAFEYAEKIRGAF